MEGFLGTAYLWVKAVHVIMVIFWMAGMFMLPRFFAYHVEENEKYGVGSDQDKAWQDRERRLMRIIINPSMCLAWAAGLALVFHLGWSTGGWLFLKLFLVICLSAYHGFLSRWRKDFSRQKNSRSSKFYRLANEIPTLATIPIIVLVIVKPF